MKSNLYVGDPAKSNPSSDSSSIRYLPDPGLVDAVNVALILARPLLLTGEPGTGKTCLAASIAAELGLGSPLRFQTKSTSMARDLFYYYDAIRHFHATQTQKASVSAAQFITIQAMGEAILRTKDPEEIHAALPNFPHSAPQRSIVLVDEVDKAPRDFPNDILYEVEDLIFEIPELGGIRFRVSPDPALQPILVFTSNSEKNLPDAFLRRCVYYHIPFPDQERLHKIVETHQGSLAARGDLRLTAAIEFFARFRAPDVSFRKRPSTAELLDWVQMLVNLDDERMTGDARPLFDEALLRKSLRVLVKAVEDFKPAEAILKQWLSDHKKPYIGAAPQIMSTARRD